MKGNFTVHLFDLLIYLFPGLVVLSSFFYGIIVFIPEYVKYISYLEQGWFIFLFLLLAYMVGHPTYWLSIPINGFDYFVSGRKKMSDRAIQRATFYKSLIEKLGVLFADCPIDKKNVTPFCLRIVSEEIPSSSLTVDRLLALMLFSRSMVVALLISSLIIVATMFIKVSVMLIVISVLLFACMLLFYRAYRGQYRSYLITCWRAAYYWLVRNENRQAKEKEV